MRFVVLGGCADMATPLLQRLRDDDDVQEVLLADLNAAKAEQLARHYGAKFRAARCDAEDSAQVVGILRGWDLAFCYIGPFYRFERKLADCAIEAGIPYVSIADDYDAYLDVIELEEKARAAGVKILTGFGNSPGLTQILARQGYNETPNPDRIHVNWCAGSDESVGESNLMHLFHIFNGTTLQWFEGREVRVRTGQGRKRVTFPEPIGDAWVYYTGHAESVSLPRNLVGLREVTLHGGVKPGYIATLVKAMSALGLFRTHARRRRLAHLFHHIEGWFSTAGLDKSVGKVEIYGHQDGKQFYRYYTYVGHIAEITSLPALLAAKWVLSGRFDALPGGVYAAERLIEAPETFLEELRSMGVAISSSPLMEGSGD
jgi:saccharopine dehydrogenase-like NADP-dependent oxidoreductase